MNKRDREQLRASIARDLVQGQGEHSPTKELLKQYAPLEGIITTPAEPATHPRPAPPVEKSLAPHATVAQKRSSPWHGATEVPDATVAPDATVERYAVVKGELRVPNTVNYSLFPTSIPSQKLCTTSSFYFRTASGETSALLVLQSYRNRFSCRREKSKTQ